MDLAWRVVWSTATGVMETFAQYAPSMKAAESRAYDYLKANKPEWGGQILVCPLGR